MVLQIQRRDGDLGSCRYPLQMPDARRAARGLTPGRHFGMHSGQHDECIAHAPIKPKCYIIQLPVLVADGLLSGLMQCVEHGKTTQQQARKQENCSDHMAAFHGCPIRGLAGFAQICDVNRQENNVQTTVHKPRGYTPPKLSHAFRTMNIISNTRKGLRINGVPSAAPFVCRPWRHGRRLLPWGQLVQWLRRSGWQQRQHGNAGAGCAVIRSASGHRLEPQRPWMKMQRCRYPQLLPVPAAATRPMRPAVAVTTPARPQLTPSH